jgi:hypothetical protein
MLSTEFPLPASDSNICHNPELQVACTILSSDWSLIEDNFSLAFFATRLACTMNGKKLIQRCFK